MVTGTTTASEITPHNTNQVINFFHHIVCTCHYLLPWSPAPATKGPTSPQAAAEPCAPTKRTDHPPRCAIPPARTTLRQAPNGWRLPPKPLARATPACPRKTVVDQSACLGNWHQNSAASSLCWCQTTVETKSLAALALMHSAWRIRIRAFSPTFPFLRETYPHRAGNTPVHLPTERLPNVAHLATAYRSSPGTVTPASSMARSETARACRR